MVCVADEPRVQCIIRRLSQSAPKSKFEITLPASTSVCELFNRVANDLNYEPHSFQLRLMTQGCDKVFTESTEGTLEDVGFCTELGSRNSLLLEGADGDDRKLVVRSPPGGGETPTHAPQPPPLLPPATSPAGDYAPPVHRHDTGYVGLVNQAMTCYLNSLLQALYMTPEFRNALYKWNFELGHNKYPSKCIPFQLQKLFLNLQTSSKTAVETTKLTRSFGWESGEVWQQHDIQELCRVMFDALEQEFKETEQADLINQLYQGKMIDYVKCLECGTEKSREDTFLDIPLPVRPFGSAVAYGSIEEALGAFVQPETLDGNNQYFCENCNKKCNAHKGLKFSKFPYLLTLHLKRFDFDYSTMHRIKLNDKVVFPQELDLNSFVRCIGDEEIIETARSCDEVSTADSVLDEEAVATQSVENQAVDHDQEEDEGIDMSTSSGNHVERNTDEKRGPFVYELYSIMIHSGSASGGHYYAYIKDFTKSEWFCFNDQSVTRITLEDIVKTYGGGPTRGYYSGAYSSSTNAYMLMYRQIDKERNATSITHDQFPPHIMKLLKEVQESEENERVMRAREEKMMKIKVYTNPNLPCPNVQTKIYCHHDTTLAETLQKAYQDLQLENIVPIEQCRLVSYNHTQDQMEVSFEGKEKETIHNILSNLKNFSNYELFLETREKNQIFPPYNVGDIGMSFYRLEGEEVVGWYGLRGSPCQELADLRKLLQMAIPLPSTDIHIILAPPITLLCDDTRPLNKIGFSHSNRLFICPRDPAIDTNSFPSSKLYKFIEKVQNVVILHIVLPDTSTDALERLLIPPLVDCKLNGNNNRHSEATPTGDKSMTLPLTNGLEEESVCGGGAGGTSDQSTSEDSSLTDSERTIIGEATSEGQLSSPSDSDQQLSSPETQLPNKIGEVNGEWEENWDDQVELNKVYYFKATPYTTQDSQKMLRVVVDRRMELNNLKGRLEKDVGVAGKYVKLFRGSDPERGDLIDTLSSLKDDDRISVKLHRVPSEGEYRVKLYVLQINSPTPVQFICDWILMRGTSVGNTKKAILKELEKRHDIKIPFDRCRLWKKNWKNQSPGKVLLDNEVWDDGDPTLACAPPKEVFVEELEGAEEATGAEDEVVLFTRRWRPSSLTLDPFKEVILTSTSVAHLKQKLSDISAIPVEHVKFAKGPSAFPCEMSVLNLHADLEWDHNVELLTDWHLNITEDGVVVFYRDSREELKELTREEQQEVRSRESVKLNGSSIIPVYSFRKEKALKIYLDLSSKSQVMEEYD